MLKYFYDSKQAEIEALKAQGDALFSSVRPKARPSFGQTLLQGAKAHGIAVIAEYKRASPSAGTINLGTTPEEAALQYQDAGATALSVLTEETRFLGELAFLERMYGATDGKIPLLRKDFLCHPLQVAATAATPAAAFLLIVQLTPDVELLRNMRELGERFGLEAVVEVFHEKDLQMARASGARIIQVNARDLHTFKVDQEAPLKLAAKERMNGPEEVWIAASGIAFNNQVRAAANAGFDAVLVGTSLMQGGHPAAALEALRAGFAEKGDN